MSDSPSPAAPVDLAALKGLEALAPGQRLKALLDHPDPRAAVQAIAPFSFYHLVREIGLEDAADLVALASPAQAQALMDLDAWKGDQFQGGPVRQWLPVLLEMDDEALQTTLRQIDLEPLALALQERAAIFVIEDPDDLPEELLALDRPYETFDGVYALVFDDEDEDGTRHLRQWLQRLYDVDRDVAWGLMEACRWELSSTMEAAAWQARSVRLEEVGFVPFDEALAIFARQDPAALRQELEAPTRTWTAPQRQDDEHDEVFLVPNLFDDALRHGQSFLARAWRGLERLVEAGQLEADLERLRLALVALTNKAVVAEAVDTSDMEATRRIYNMVQGYITVALEFISERDLPRAAALLGQGHPQRLFQAGHTMAWRLAAQARKLTSGELASRLTLLDETRWSLLEDDDRLMLEGLLERRPACHQPGLAYTEPFADLGQLEAIAARLSRLAFKITAVFGILGLDHGALATAAFAPGLTPPVEAISLEVVLRTAIARAWLGQPRGLGPLDAQELASLVEGPLADAPTNAAPDQHPLYQLAAAVLVDVPGLDTQARAVARALCIQQCALLMEGLGHLAPQDLRDGLTRPEDLGDLLLMRVDAP